MNEQNFLVGRTLTGMKIADDKGALLFNTTDGDVLVRADGDCCSHTWVEHVELPVSFPCVVSAVDDLDMREPQDDGDYEVIKFYGCKIVTDKGDIVIDYRNSSNGYYGGNLVWPDDRYFYGGVYGQNVSNQNWVEISP